MDEQSIHAGENFVEPLMAEPIVDDIQADTDSIVNDPDHDVPVDQASALGPARHIQMTIIAQDPAVLGDDDTILRASVSVAADRFREPFQTHRFQVVSYDPASAGPGPDLHLLDVNGKFKDRFEKAPDATLIASNDFHAQNAYAIASRTLAEFEAGLGRRVPWDFPGHQLYVVPHGETQANAYYSPDRHALIFGLVPESNGIKVYSCLSHDIVAHETTHAILDGLPRSGPTAARTLTTRSVRSRGATSEVQPGRSGRLSLTSWLADRFYAPRRARGASFPR
jgi:hypothetical protein